MKRTLTPAEHAALLSIRNNAAPLTVSRPIAPKPNLLYMVGLTCHGGECVKPLGWFWTYAAAEAACPALALQHDATHLHIAEIVVSER